MKSNWTRPRKFHAASAPKEPGNALAKMRGIIAVAISFVKVGTGTHVRSVVGRVVVCNAVGDILLDSICRPEVSITDYCTPFTGLTEPDFEKSVPARSLSAQLTKMLGDKIVVGSNTRSVLRALRVKVSPSRIKDLNIGPYALEASPVTTSSSGYTILDVSTLASRFLDLTIDQDPASVAKAIMRLYLRKRSVWERDVSTYYKTHKTRGGETTE